MTPNSDPPLSQKHFNWQPILLGSRLRIRPLRVEDFDELHRAASDPLIWKQHPDPKRFELDRFSEYFQSAIESQGALAILDLASGQLIGSSRFTGNPLPSSSIEIGYTFLTRENWGGERNRELKFLMLHYAFQWVDTVYFVVGQANHRSQKALAKIGADELQDTATLPLEGDLSQSVVFGIQKSEWISRSDTFIPFEQSGLETDRLQLEPIFEHHFEEVWNLFDDPELHRYVPFDPVSIQAIRERCARWEKRRPADHSEIWLNWLARDKTSRRSVAHFQAGLKPDGVASIGYMVARDFQGKGIGAEGMSRVIEHLRDDLKAREVKAWSDTRNLASHRLAKKLGMKQVEFIPNADHFKGGPSDEFVFSKILNP